MSDTIKVIVYNPDLRKKFKIRRDVPNEKKFLILAFVFPVLLMIGGFAYSGIFPFGILNPFVEGFGDGQILVTDFWHQYYQFFSEFQDKLQNGGSMLWNWHSGLGVNFIALMAYYFASPLNLLSIIIPQELAREAMTVFLLIRIGCAGLFMGMFLKYTYRRNNILITIFGTLYALCAFAMGYYWNIMWMDSFALAPLVFMGVVAIVRENRYRLFIGALALSFFANYYVGFFICIFTAIYFLALCIIQKLKLKEFLKKTLLIAGSSVVGLGMTLAVTLPAYLALQIANSAGSKFPFDRINEWEHSFVDIIGNFAAFTPPSSKEGLPNVYCGVICVLLFGIFLVTKRISLREKIVNCAVLLFLLLSCSNKVLDYIWHGFHFTNMIPHRFSFLISFLLIALAFRAVMFLKEMNIYDVAMMCVMAVFLAVFTYFGQQDEMAVYVTLGLSVLFIGAFYLYTSGHIKKSSTLATVLLVLVLVEMVGNMWQGMDEVGKSTRSTFPSSPEQMAQLIESAEEDNAGEELFFRSEVTKPYTINDPALYKYNGVTVFTSTANVNITLFAQAIGLSANGPSNRYLYFETSPFTNLLLNVKYNYVKNDNPESADAKSPEEVYSTKISSADDLALYKNKYTAGMGFMVNSEAVDFEGDINDPFTSQQQLFKLMTGLDGELFESIDVLDVGHKNLEVGRTALGEYSYKPTETINEEDPYRLKFNYIVPEDCVLYGYSEFRASGSGDIPEQISVIGPVWREEYKEEYGLATEKPRDVEQSTRSKNVRRPFLYLMGEYKKGEIVTIQSELPENNYEGKFHTYVKMFNQKLFNEGFEKLSDEKYIVTEMTDTMVKGTVTALEDGLLYTSIPYESGWKAYVDGKETQITPVGDAMASVPLTAGEHEVTFKYSPAGFVPGLIISILSLVIYVCLIFADKYYFVKRRKVSTALAADDDSALYKEIISGESQGDDGYGEELAVVDDIEGIVRKPKPEPELEGEEELSDFRKALLPEGYDEKPFEDEDVEGLLEELGEEEVNDEDLKRLDDEFFESLEDEEDL